MTEVGVQQSNNNDLSVGSYVQVGVGPVTDCSIFLKK